MKARFSIIRRAIAGLAISTAALIVPACGGQDRHAGQSALPGDALVTAYFPHSANDRDNDGDHNDDDAHDLFYGHAAGATDRAEIVAVVTRYYAAAVSRNGRFACALLASFIAESVVEQYGDQPSMSGSSCAAVVSKLFANHRQELAIKRATLKVPDVRVDEDKALVIVEFPAIREVRQLRLRHLDGRWRLLQLRDTILE